MSASLLDRPIVTLTPNPAVDVATGCDAVEPNRKLRCSAPRVDPGGGGINVSRVIGRLGGRTRAIFTQGGVTGERLVLAIREEGIEIDPIEVSSPTRESFTVTEKGTGNLFRFVMPGNPIRPEEGRALVDRFEMHLAGASLAVGSGSLPQGVPDDFWGDVARRARGAGRPFVLDTSQAIGPALEVGVTILRFNHNEIVDLAGSKLAWPGEMAQWCRELVAGGGAETVIVTHGADGALLTDRDGHVLSRPPKVTATSAVGAGDSFIAGLTFALVRGDRPEEALRLAMVSASAALITSGTELARSEDIERLLAEAPPAEPLEAVHG